MNDFHDDGYIAEPSLAFDRGAAPLIWWRDRDPENLETLLSRPDNYANLAMQVARVRPAAIEIARVLDDGDGSALIGAVLGSARRRRVAHDFIADDLLALALLLEGLFGDATAQLVVDHLRRRRNLPSLPWPTLRRAFEKASSAPRHGAPSKDAMTSPTITL